MGIDKIKTEKEKVYPLEITSKNAISLFVLLLINVFLKLFMD